MRRFALLAALLASVICIALPGARAQTASPALDPLIYAACMEVLLDQLRQDTGEEQKAQSVAQRRCQILSGTCQKADLQKEDRRAEACKKLLHHINSGLERFGSSLPFMAASAGRTDLVETFVEIKIDINKPVLGLAASPSGSGWTPLMIAAAEGHPETVSALIRAGANVNATNTLGRTALMFASSKGFPGIVKDLLAHRADPNIIPTDANGWTALIVAARTGRIDVIKVLLDHGADVTINDKEGKTALAWAEAQGHADVVRVLTEATPKK